MTRTVVIHQPDFLPYLGFFHRLLSVDLFVILDNVQFVHSNRSWTNRDKIKTPHGECWVTVSVKKSPRDTLINQIELSQTVDWRTDNLNLIRQNYRPASFFKEIYPSVELLYSSEDTKLMNFNLRSIEMLMSFFGICIPLVLASSLGVDGKKNELLANILRTVGATHYLSGIGAKAYLDLKFFADAGIDVTWQDFDHPVYPQLYGEFIPYLSSIDLLFNCGIEKSRQVLRGR